MKRASSQRTSFVTLARPSIRTDCNPQRSTFAREPGDERRVRGEDVEVAQLIGRAPQQVGDLDGARHLRRWEAAAVDEHQQVELWIRVEQDVPDGADLDGDAELLAELARERVGRGFSVL